MPEQIKVVIAVDDKGTPVIKSFQRSMEGGFKSAARSTDSFKLKLGELEPIIKNLVSIAAFYQLGNILRGSIVTAEQMENSLRGLAAIARYSGEDIGRSMDAAASLSKDGLIDIRSAAIALQNLLSRGFSLKESISMIERLKDAAAFNRQSHLSMSEAVASATEGLKNENSVLVDNAGVTKNVSIMWKEYAASIGKGVDGLTQAEKRQAEFNGIMKETEGQIGNASLAMEGLTGMKARLNTEVTILSANLGKSLTPAFLELAEAMNWFTLNVMKPFLGGLEMAGVKAGALNLKLEALTEYGLLKALFKPGELKEQWKEIDLPPFFRTLN